MGPSGQMYFFLCTHVYGYYAKTCILTQYKAKIETTTPYAHIRSQHSSSLHPKVTECSHFNSSEYGFVCRLGQPGHPMARLKSRTFSAEYRNIGCKPSGYGYE